MTRADFGGGKYEQSEIGFCGRDGADRRRDFRSGGRGAEFASLAGRGGADWWGGRVFCWEEIACAVVGEKPSDKAGGVKSPR